jgi:hypothetical protein
MEAQGLMVGNYLKKDGITVKIDARSIFDMFNDNTKYEPIPLTEDLLINLGCEKLNHKMSNCHVFTLGYWRVATNDFINYSLWHERISPPTWVLAEFKNYHEFQNLIFALTGKEITL